MSQWTEPATLTSPTGELTCVGYVDDPAFTRAIGLAKIDSVMKIDQHGDVEDLMEQFQAFVGQPLSAWRKFAKANPRKVKNGYHESWSGRRRTYSGQPL